MKRSLPGLAYLTLALALVFCVALLVPAIALAVDLTPPVTTVHTDPLMGPDGKNGWYVNGSVWIWFSASEPSETWYNWDLGLWYSYWDPFPPRLGIHTLYFYGVDPFGNVESLRSAVFKYDPTYLDRPTTSTASGWALGTDSVHLEWTPATDGISGIAGYNIYDADTNALLATTTSTAHTFGSLTPGATYRYYVKAEDIAGNLSSAGNTVTVTTPAPDTQPPTTTLTTTPTAPNGNNGWYTTSTVAFLTPDEPAATFYSWDTTAWLPYSIGLAAPQGSHALRYYSLDTAGNVETAKSQAIKVDTGAPGASTITVVSIAPTSVSLRWTASSDGVSGLAGYRVYNWMTGALMQTTSATSTTLINLTPSTNYRFYVKAEDNAGNLSASSNLVMANTPASDVTPPTVGSVTPASGASGVATDTNVSAAMSESIASTSVIASTFSLRTAGSSATVPASLSVAGNILTLNPSANLSLNTSYTATLTTGISDLSGNHLAANYTWSFKTVAPPPADTRPPVTNLTTMPPWPDGRNGWFVTAPLVILTPDETAASFYAWDTTATWLPYSMGLVAPAGSHVLGYYSLDTAGNAETPGSLSFNVDTGAPSAPSLSSASHTPGVPSSDNSIDAVFSGGADSVSGVDGYSVLWSQGAFDDPDNIKDFEETAGSLTSNPLADGSWYLHIKTLDNAGNSSAAAHIGPFVIQGPPASGAGKIVFASDRGGNYDVYIMDADGANQTQLTGDPSLDFMPAISADGSKIAFVSLRDGNREIYIMDSNGSSLARLTNNTASELSPSFSRDGSKLVFSSWRDGNWEIYSMNVDGTNQTRLTNNAAADDDPAFSPDGTKIVFESARSGNTEIYQMSADGSSPTDISNNPAYDGDPVYSPDGAKIAFYSNRNGANAIFTMNSDGTGQTAITNGLPHRDKPSYSPDGAKIALTAYVGGSPAYEIYVINADGTGPANTLAYQAAGQTPDWSSGPATPADTSAPVTSLTSVPPTPNGNNGWYTTSTVAFLTPDEPAVSFYSWDTTATWLPYSAAITAPEGNHLLYYYSLDGAGNVETPKSQLFRVDTTGPDAPTLSVASTGATTATLSWTPSADSHSGVMAYHVYNAFTGAFVQSSTGTSAILVGLSPSSTYRYYVIAEDNAGNRSAAGNYVMVYTLAADASAPVTTLTSTPSSPNGANGWYKTVPTITLTPNEPAAGFYSWDTTGTWLPYSISLSAPQGIHTLYYYSVDGAGNVEASKSRQVQTDSGLPSMPTISGSAVGPTRIDLTWTTSTDSVSGLAYYELSSLDTSPVVTTTTATSYSVTGLTPNRQYRFFVKGVDTAGNLSVRSAMLPIVTPPLTPPTTSLSASPSLADGDNGWYKTAPAIALTPNETATTFYAWDSTASWLPYPAGLVAAEGNHLLYYYSVDGDGAAEAPKSRAFKVDTGAPVDPVVSSPSHAVGVPSSDDTIDVALTGASDALSGLDGYSVAWTNSATETAPAAANLAGDAVSATSPVLADGVWFAHLRAKDAAGNWSEGAHAGPFAIDTAAPAVTLASSPAAPDGAGGWYVTVPAITVSADEPGAIVYYRWDGGDWLVYGGPLAGPEGVHTLDYYSIDEAGNSGSVDSQTFSVDTLAPSAPSLTAPVYSTDISANSAFAVNWSGADATPSSGSTYDVQYKAGAAGTYTGWLTDSTLTAAAFSGSAGNTYYFRARARDGAGNTSGWATEKVTIAPYDQSVFSYSGSWSSVSSSSLYLGGAKYSSSKGSAATYSFSGAAEVTLIATKRANAGKADVYIGSTKIKTIDLYSSSTKYRVPVLVKTYAAPTSGTLKVVLTDKKNSSSSGYRLELDGVAVKR